MVRLLILCLLGVASIEAAFDRDCEGSHCKFRPSGQDGQAWLACTPDGKKCACDRYRYIMDVPSWSLEVNNGECQIASSGPCGEDRGLQIGCQGDSTCIQGRCRRSSDLGQGQLYSSCHDDLDCISTLRCKVAGFYYHQLKGCIPPETAPYDPAKLGFGHLRNNPGVPPPPRN